MRNSGIYTFVCLCVYTLQVITLTIIWLDWLFVFVSISNSFDVKSDDFCLLKIWIYELLLINVKQRSVQQSIIFAHELLSIFRENFYCLSLATVAVDINVETLKRNRNSVLLSQFAKKVVEACFLRNITGWDYLLENWFKINFPKIWLYFYMTVSPQLMFIVQRTEYCFEVYGKTMEDLR